MTLPCEGFIPYLVLGKLIEFGYNGEWSPDEGWIDVEYTLPLGSQTVGFRDILNTEVVDSLDKMTMIMEKGKLHNIV